MAPAAERTLLSGASAPSEMSLETNVLRYLANCLECRAGLEEGSVEMASPTQNEEAHMGYDSQVKLPDGRYVLLQFKRPLPCRPNFSFGVPSAQVSLLLGPETDSSFFALPAVGTNDEMWGAKTALLGRTAIVDAWDLYAPLAASMPEGFCWIYGSEPVTRTVRVDAGADAGPTAVLKGRGRNNFESIPSRPISCLCDGTGGYGFAVRGGAVVARGGRKLSRQEWRKAVESRRRAYEAAYLDRGGDGPRERGFRGRVPSDNWIDVEFAKRPDRWGGLRAGGGGGRYAIRIGDA